VWTFSASAAGWVKKGQQQQQQEEEEEEEEEVHTVATSSAPDELAREVRVRQDEKGRLGLNIGLLRAKVG
jgi:Spy/CpxP family protein refolding chaperone